VRLRGKLTPEHVFEGIAGCEFSASGNIATAVLKGDTASQAATLRRIKEALRSRRAGSIVRVTVEAAEAAAVDDFGEAYVLVQSLAHRRTFEVGVKAKSRAAFYVLGRAGRVLSKKEYESALMDAFV